MPRTGISNMVNDGINGTKNMAEGAMNMAEGAMNMTEGAMNAVGDAAMGDVRDNAAFSTTGNYTAARTSMTDTQSGNITNSAAFWMIIAVSIVIIVALVWYYMTQTNDRETY